MNSAPLFNTYDVVIIGGGIFGASISWFLASNADFNGTILVVEKDPTYEFASTSHTNSCMRQQFSQEINIQVSRFAADFIDNIRHHFGGDERVPELSVHNLGYMYMADSQSALANLKINQKLQASCGAGTIHKTPAEIARDFPFYNLDDILGANHNLVNEGYFDGATLFDWWKRSGKERGVEYLANEVTAIDLNTSGNRVDGITLKTGEKIGCGIAVNASGPRAVLTSRMAGIDLPVEPRKRYTFVFDAQNPLSCDLPLTIDPCGVHVRADGKYFLAGCAPEHDVAVDFDDFSQDHSLWENKVWPAIAHRIPKFEAIKLVNSWVGHYAYNTFDQNAILGHHTKVGNFVFANGFSGHGLQQSPAMGRGTCELITYGEYRTLDLTPFDYRRIPDNKPFVELAVI